MPEKWMWASQEPAPHGEMCHGERQLRGRLAHHGHRSTALQQNWSSWLSRATGIAKDVFGLMAFEDEGWVLVCKD